MVKSRVKADDIVSKKEQFGIWLGMPKYARRPSSMDELAVEMDVSVRSLKRWQFDPVVLHNKENSLKILASKNDQYEIIQALINKAKAGNSTHIKLFLEWQGEIGPINRKQDKEEPRKFEVKIVS